MESMYKFLEETLAIDSTSERENDVAMYIKEHFHPEGSELEIQETKDGRLNLFFKWGQPKIIFCSHMDTVPPFIPPKFKKNAVHGRGSCDAKGQLACMYEVCNQLRKEQNNNFGLLMLAGEEDGSHGAKRANELIQGCEFVIVGEPTRNKLIKASKGAFLARVTFHGTSCHSGYQRFGDDAIKRMMIFLDRLSRIRYLYDKDLGETSYSLGRLKSDNAHNVLSDNASVNIYFRTTHTSHHLVKEVLLGLADAKTEIKFGSNDEPLDFYTVPGFDTDIVSYGTDAPSLYNLGERLLFGPGDILNAHTQHEYVTYDELEKAVKDLRKIFLSLQVSSLRRRAVNY
jgi:acetylornithine deacetylase